MYPRLAKLSSKAQFTLPRGWVRENHLKVGDKLYVFVRRKGRGNELCVVPANPVQQAELKQAIVP